MDAHGHDVENSTMNSISFRASKANPCPVCGSGSKNCSATADGLHFCRGEARDGWRKLGEDDNGFGHYRRNDEPPAMPSKAKPSKPKPPPRNWHAEAERYAANLESRPDLRARLAEVLRLPLVALIVFMLGLNRVFKDSVEFTIPERDGEGTIIGLATRIERKGKPPEKKAITDSKRGLTVPSGWQDTPGKLYLPEGFSNTVAMTAAGLCAIGRPSNLSGVEFLAELVTSLPPDREVEVVGDRDQKPNGEWPGRFGAETTAKKLTEMTGRLVKWTLPPEGSKDVRDWLTASEREGTPWPDRGAELIQLLEENAEGVEPPAANAEGGHSADAPEIVIGTDEHRVNAEACIALGRERDIYQRGGLLVHVVEQAIEPATDAVVRRPIGAVNVRELAQPLLRERLTSAARWVKWRGNGEDAQKVPAHPPDWSVSAIHVRADWETVRRLEAVVTHPVLLGNGKILSANGYDEASQLLVMMPPGLSINVPEYPTREDVAAAVELLAEVIRDFPFETPEHRAAWFAALLTPLAWFAFTGPAPLFLIDANIRAAGKGLLADVIAIIITGRRFPVMSYTNDKEELRKKITTLAVEGERLVLLDNLAGAVGNDVLDMALTAETWTDRLLGGNRKYNGPLNVTWFATGNNVQLGADTSRRACHIRLESEQERPETRADVKYADLRGHVTRNRGPLLAAALTILRGWIVAGKPKHGLKPWGSFEQWSNVVREAVVFAGLPDPGETRLQLQSMADSDANAMEAIIAGLDELDTARRGMTTAEIVKRLKDDESPSECIADMRAAVEELCGKLCGRLLGYKFRHFIKRNFNGRMIDKASSAQGKNRWVIVTAGARRGPKDPHHRTHPTDAPHAGGCDGGDGGDVSGEDAPASAKPSKKRIFGNNPNRAEGGAA